MSTSAYILIVDDEQSVRTFLCRVMKRAGYTVLSAESGPNALQQLSDDVPLDLAVLDGQMPEMSGWVLAHELRKRYQELPVLFYSGCADLEAQQKTDPLPNSLFLAKPVGFSIILGAVETLLSQDGH